ncbi:MAG: acetate--CoA ligase family protein [Spirochaetota bacterium]
MKQKYQPSWLQEIDALLGNAFKEGRHQLYEFEVYKILEILGLKTPRYFFARDEADITNYSLSLFGSSKIVLKVVSKSIAHKQKLGGVSIVYKDLEFVRYSFKKMRSVFQSRGQNIEGILLVDYIDYSKDLGNEVLLGFRESESFGPVISFSKGGTDAEHFAANFSAPNLLLPPVDREWASALLLSTKIHEKYEAEGKADYITKIIDAELKLSSLSISFSNFFKSTAGYTIKEFEINPFVFNYDDNFIALDGYATFKPKEIEPVDLALKPKETLSPFFEPRGIAVIGVSRSESLSAGYVLVKNLLHTGRDDVYCVNARGGTVEISGKTYRLFTSICEIDDPVDLAIITVPAEATLPVVRECVKRGVKGILLIPGGFSEINKNREVEEEILATAGRHSIRLMGPNCLGIILAGDENKKGMNTFFIPEEKFKVSLDKEKNVAILSQSGAMGIMEIYNLKNAISPRVIVSYGNQLDIDPADLVQYFDSDPSVDVIGLYIEGFKRGGGRKFFNVGSKSRKPIIVYKAGRTEAGKKAAQSHTASIAGEYEVAKAAMKQAGLIVADSMIDHGDFVKTFALLHDFKVSGKRVAVIANAGYEKTYAADNLGDMVLAELDKPTEERLKEVLPPFANVDALLDLTPMVTDEQYEKCIDIMLSSDKVDAICLSIVPQAQILHTTDEEIDTYKENIAARIVATVHKHKKPAVISVNVVYGTDAIYNKFGQVLDAGGVPTFLTAERAMVCLNAFIRYKLIKEKHVLSEWLR